MSKWVLLDRSRHACHPVKLPNRLQTGFKGSRKYALGSVWRGALG
jgi:hypothetical protein